MNIIPDTALAITHSIEINNFISTVDNFFKKRFPSKIKLLPNVRKLRRAAIEISLEQTAILLQVLIERRAGGKTLPISVFLDGERLCLQADTDALLPISEEDFESIKSRARAAGFSAELSDALTFSVEISMTAEYLVFVRSKEIIDNIFDFVFNTADM